MAKHPKIILKIRPVYSISIYLFLFEPISKWFGDKDFPKF
jgi:hypothetical protein